MSKKMSNGKSQNVECHNVKKNVECHNVKKNVECHNAKKNVEFRKIEKETKCRMGPAGYGKGAPKGVRLVRLG